MKSNIRVLKSSLPLHLEGTNGKAVLVLHGFNGYPAEMYGLAYRLNDEGYTVSLPRLPGHATNAADFRASNCKQWLSYTRNQYLDLQGRFDSVSIVGLSMGADLALITAAEFSPENIILLAPAIAVSNKLVHFTPILKYIIPSLVRKRAPEPDADEDRQYMEKEYWSKNYTALIVEFRKVMMISRRNLKDVRCPVYMMLSEKDSTVPLRAGDIIERGVSGPIRKLMLKNSPHVFFEGPENDFVLDKVAEWMRDLR